MPVLIRTVAFTEDERIRVFSPIESASILCEHDPEAPRLRAVRRAATDREAFKLSEIQKLKDALEGAVEDRQTVVEELRSSGAPGAGGLAAAAAQWLDPLAAAWSLACDAETILLGGGAGSTVVPGKTPLPDYEEDAA